MSVPVGAGNDREPESLYKWKDEEGVVYGSRVRSWGGWPDDIRDEVKRWNSSRVLTFVYGPRVFECGDCHRYIDRDGATACRLHGVLLCDDCIASRVRAHLEVVNV